MQRAAMWLNLYGRQAVRCKLKKGVKTQKMHFYPFFELTSDCLTTIQVKPHRCPLHQLILITQGPIPEISRKNIENWRSPKMTLFFVFCFWLLGFQFIFSQLKSP
jgi:hypothetical protein